MVDHVQLSKYALYYKDTRKTNNNTEMNTRAYAYIRHNHMWVNSDDF